MLKHLILINGIKFHLVCMAKFWLLQGKDFEVSPRSDGVHATQLQGGPTHIGGSTSGITDVRRGKRLCRSNQKRGICERSNAAGAKVSGKGGGGGAPSSGAEILLQPVGRTHVG